MLKAKGLENFYFLSFYILAFSIPFPFITSSVAIILLTVAAFLNTGFKTMTSNLKKRRYIWPWILYFLLFCASYFYSENKSQSAFDLQSKLSLLILPLTIGGGPSITSTRLRNVFLAFVLGITTVGLYSIIKSGYILYETGYTPIMFYHNLVKDLDANAVYMAWYTLLSITMLLLYNWKGSFLHYKLAKYIFILFQLTFFVLLSARMLILLSILIITPIYLRNTLKNKRFQMIKIISFIVLVGGILSVIIFTKNPIKERYKNLYSMSYSKAWLNDYSNVEVNEFSNLTLRLFLWRIGLENIKEHNLWLLGAGNGDAQNLQNDKMREYKIKNIEKEGVERSELYNANLHNMFLQTLMMVGLPGLLMLLFMVFSPFIVISAIDSKYIFFVFLTSSTLFLFQESALQTQAGIVYYAFFMQIFWNVYYAQIQKKLANILK